jgi:hypothetical protein
MLLVQTTIYQLSLGPLIAISSVRSPNDHICHFPTIPDNLSLRPVSSVDVQSLVRASSRLQCFCLLLWSNMGQEKP